MNYSRIYSFPVVFLVVLLSSCKTNDAIIDDHSKERIIGYRNAPLIIGKTQCATVTNIEELKNRGLYLQFNDDKTLKVVYIRKAGYCTDKHICIGDPLENIVGVYGAPQGKELSIKSGNVDIASLSGAFYEKWLFFPDSINNIKEITLGEHGVLDGRKK